MNIITIDLSRKFQQVLPRPSLIAIYKVFTRSHFDYGDVTLIMEMSFLIKLF